MFFKCLNPRRALPPIRKNGFRVICHIINVFCLSSFSLIFQVPVGPVLGDGARVEGGVQPGLHLLLPLKPDDN